LNGLHWRAVDDATKARLRVEAGDDVTPRRAGRTRPSRSA
jgi:hypothetical protein